MAHLFRVLKLNIQKKIKKKKSDIKKITKQIYEITYLFNHFKAIIVANKLVPLNL